MARELLKQRSMKSFSMKCLALGIPFFVGCVVGGGGHTTGTTTSGAGGGNPGSGGGAACTQPQPGAAISLEVAGAKEPTGPLGMPTDVTLQGAVLASAPGTVVIDSCPPGTKCFSAPAKLTVSATGVPAVLAPVGAFVKLRFVSGQTIGGDGGMGSETLAYLENLPTWSGSANPVSSESRVWLDASSSGGCGGFPIMLNPPYRLESVAQCGAGTNDWVDALKVTFPNTPPITVRQGEQGVIAVGSHHYTLANLVNTGNLDACGSFSYFLVGN